MPFDRLKRRDFITLLGAAASVTVTAPLLAAGQDYPNRPVTLIVNFPPGGSTDAMARIIREPLIQALGQSIIIDNRGGAGGTTGAAAVANARPDGYTILLSVNSALTTNRYLQKNFPFDPKTAFAPITLTSDVALVLAVHPSLPVHDVTGLIEYARKNPGKLAYNVKVGFYTLPVALPQAQAGAIRVIAAAEKTRLPELPDTPTIDETVPGVINVGWNGLLAPAGTPAPIIDKLNAAAVAALKMPDIVAKMKLQGLHPLSSTPAEFASLLVSEVDHWAKVIPSIGIQPE